MGTPPLEPPPPPPGADEPAKVEPTCPRCGAPHDPYQEYCLECGLRLVPLPGSYYRRDLWSRDSPVWLWLALAALLIVALAGALAAVAASKDEMKGSPVVTAGSGKTETIGTFTEPATLTIGPPTTTPTLTTIQPTTTIGTTTFPTTAPTTTTTTHGSGTTISWPSGKDGYTVVLRSTPTSDGRGPAEAAAQRAINAGLPQVGILDSSNYSSLRSGYYVTFTGVYDTLNEAEAALPRARSAGFPLAYVREVAD
jgi:hypothetical protein